MPLGRVCGAQLAPALVVAITTPLSDKSWPTARQSEVLAHETASSAWMPVGSFSVVHVAPPSVVETAPAIPDKRCPTAQQSQVLAQAMPSSDVTVAGSS